jgi:two-component system sensor histidine kinase CpxA
LTRIEQETERLDGLVGQILTLTRLRSPLTGQRAPLDLGELVREVIANARFEYPNVAIELDAADVPEIRGDRGELGSAIENVIRNALVHAGQTPVRVVLRKARQGVEVRISDHGPGVAEENLKRIFEPFFRVDPSRDHQRGGYGLGLAIAASVVARHHGMIEARGGAEGGLEIILVLPTGAPESAQRL